MLQSILFVTHFAELEPVGSNNLLGGQVLALQEMGYRVEILTWPSPAWRGPVPDGTSDRLAGVPYLTVERRGRPYHVVAPPRIWSERVLNDEEWEAAVEWGGMCCVNCAPAWYTNIIGRVYGG